MSNSEAKAPKAIIEQADGPSAFDADAGAQGAAPGASPDGGAAGPTGDSRASRGFQDVTIGFFEGVGRVAWAYADAHPHATLYGILGFVLAVLILVIGLWDTLVIAVFVIVGIIIGQMVDDKSPAVDFINRWRGGR